MPELPEVETVKSGLQQLLPGRIVSSVVYDWPKGFPNSQLDIDKFLIGATVMEVRRRAKVLFIELSTKYSLVIHLKMTGQLVFRGETSFGAGHPSDSLVGELPDKSTRVTISFQDGSKLFFNDQRKFGWMRLLPTAEVPNIDFFKKVGPEPLAQSFTAADFIHRVRKRANTTVKAAILDQTVVAGIGNIYADESLYMAKIYPGDKVNSLSEAKLRSLFTAIRSVLQLSIDKGGSSDRNYVNAEGQRGSYLGFAQVFRRQGQACNRCGHTIEKIRIANRGTHICPFCQKPKRVVT